MRNEVPEGFAFRHEDNGPRRDVGREFYELVQDLSWMKAGPEWDDFMAALLEARVKALIVADGMLRS